MAVCTLHEDRAFYFVWLFSQAFPYFYTKFLFSCMLTEVVPYLWEIETHFHHSSITFTESCIRILYARTPLRNLRFLSVRCTHITFLPIINLQAACDCLQKLHSHLYVYYITPRQAGTTLYNPSRLYCSQPDRLFHK